MRNVLALLIVMGMLGLIAALFVFPIPESETAKTAIVAFVTGGFITMVNYFFGSSSGSRDKDETIGKIALNPPIGDSNGRNLSAANAAGPRVDAEPRNVVTGDGDVATTKFQPSK